MSHLRSCIALALSVFSVPSFAQSASAMPRPPSPTGPGLTFVTDDFDLANLRVPRWRFMDPFGDAEMRVVGAGTADARLHLSVPAGRAHEPWRLIESPRVVQTVENEDFEVAVKFENGLDRRYQEQGLVVEQDHDDFLRLEFHHDGSSLRVFASKTTNGNPTILLNQAIAAGPWPAGSPLWLWVSRSGNLFTLRWSQNGQGWTSAVAFSHPMQVTAIGPFVGNAGSNVPAHTAIIDYVADMSLPLQDEDFRTPPDRRPPLLYRFAGQPSAASEVELRWGTDERAAALVEYGRTSEYELGIAATGGLDWTGSAFVGALDADTTYHFRLTATDARRFETVSSDVVVHTLPEGASEGPVYEIWYGEPNGAAVLRRFGHLGHPQRWVNVLGRVHDLTGTVTSLRYRLNGGLLQNLAIGPADPFPYRLTSPGDFNVEIDRDDLSEGHNEVVLEAIDDDGHTGIARVHIDYTPDQTWELPSAIDWDAVDDLQDAVHVVDGLWGIVQDPHAPGEHVVRTTRFGYDRLLDVGDVLWESYEVTVPVTVHGFDPAGFTPSSNSYAVGLILRWTGHTDTAGNQQPRAGFFPFGGLFAYRWYPDREEWNHYGTNFSPNLRRSMHPLRVGVPAVMKARVETLSDGRRWYRLRVWDEGDPEPGDWFFQAFHAAGSGNSHGSVLLLSNHVDVSFGDVSIVPLP